MRRHLKPWYSEREVPMANLGNVQASRYMTCRSLVRRESFTSPALLPNGSSILHLRSTPQSHSLYGLSATENFTRKLSFSTHYSCHVFIQLHFSGDSNYLHIAALEARPEEHFIAQYLQISTHRLSSTRTTRSPPRLVYRTTASLGLTNSLSVSRSPYTLQWAEKHVYVTTRGTKLSVRKIPLFRDIGEDPESKGKECQPQRSVFLPRTVDFRTLWFIPSTSTPKERPPHTDKNAAGKFVTVIVGSHSPIPNQRLVVPQDQVSPPIVVRLHEDKDLGGWTCKKSLIEDMQFNNTGGRLKGKFESFDLNDDCDLIPSLY